ncbi:MAG: hypothetical protein HRU69_09425 [Flammeovirgaceae bacterium]|nr:MAG: hypothetical protein HRU69_09425 [Flammeovirgaceae bacterium]
MYRKQNIGLLVSSGVLVTLTVLVFILQHRENGIDKNLFKVADLTAVDRVELTSKSGTIELTFDGVRWKVNGKPADADMVQVLMATLAQAEPRRPMPKLLRDSTAAALAEKGVRVSLFAGSQPVLTFFAGGNRQKTEAIFLKQGEVTPYSVVIPGYRVYVSGIFEVDETGWLNRRIFNFNWRNFKSLKVTFPSIGDSFEVSYDGTMFSIPGVKTDTARLNTFLDQISLLEADRLVTNKPLRDSLASAQPAVTLQVATLAGKVFLLALYTKPGAATAYGLTELAPVAVFDQRKVSPLVQHKVWFTLK